MELPFEKIAAELLKDIEKHRTAECLSVDMLDEYIEHMLPSEQWDKVENHLRSCVYCVNQLVELKELLFLGENAEPLPKSLDKKLRQLAIKESQSTSESWFENIKENAATLINATKTVLGAKYTWQAVSAGLLVLLLFQYPGLVPKKPEDDTKRIALKTHEPKITVSEKEVSGSIVREADNLVTVPLGLLSALGSERSQINGATAQRIVSALQSVGKTLILEQTRGLADVEVYRKAAQAVVYVTDSEEKSSGSGAVIDAKGYILTNWHVVRDQQRVFVVLKPKDSSELKKELIFVAVVEKIDEVADLALLRILNPPAALKYLQLGDEQTIAVGQDVHAIGHPQGKTWTYTKGVVSQIRDNYEWSPGDGRTHKAKVIQTQTPINPGNSGGPLLDDNARLIGINSFNLPQAQGLNFAVAVDVVQKFLKREGPSLPAPTDQKKGNTKAEASCPDAYDTTGRGWNDIVGCYQTPGSPPPGLWLIFPAPNNPPIYSATSTLRRGVIDTVILSPDQKWENLTLLYDVDCNGTIDLIGHQDKGSAGITSFSLPQNPMRTADVTKELDKALKSRKIPYPNLKVCQ